MSLLPHSLNLCEAEVLRRTLESLQGHSPLSRLKCKSRDLRLDSCPRDSGMLPAINFHGGTDRAEWLDCEYPYVLRSILLGWIALVLEIHFLNKPVCKRDVCYFGDKIFVGLTFSSWNADFISRLGGLIFRVAFSDWPGREGKNTLASTYYIFSRRTTTNSVRIKAENLAFYIETCVVPRKLAKNCCFLSIFLSYSSLRLPWRMSPWYTMLVTECYLLLWGKLCIDRCVAIRWNLAHCSSLFLGVLYTMYRPAVPGKSQAGGILQHYMVQIS